MKRGKHHLPCTIDGCGKRATGGRGWCPMHWKRWRVHGDPLTAPRPYARTLADRLWPRLTIDGDCWIWTGPAPDGYGRISLGGQAVGYPHRVAYELMIAKIPAGLELDHLCRRPLCCNPYHLEPVTMSVNRARGNRDAARERRKAIT